MFLKINHKKNTGSFHKNVVVTKIVKYLNIYPNDPRKY